MDEEKTATEETTVETLDTTVETPDTTVETPPEGAKTVPHGAMHEERERRKAAEDELKTLRTKLDTLAPRVQQFDAWMKEQTAEQQRLEEEWSQPEWDDTDPAAQNEYIKTRLDNMEKGFTDWTSQQSQQTEMSAFNAQVDQAVATFKQEAPDFDAAANHYWSQRMTEMQAIYGPQAQEAVTSEMYALAATSMQAGENPAKKVYELAKARGYTPETAEEKIERTSQAQAAAKSMSSAGGQPETELSLESLAEMSDEEFAKLSPSEWKKAMGG